MLALDHFQNLLQLGFQCVCNMSGYKCVGSSAVQNCDLILCKKHPNLVWQLSDFQEAPRMTAVEVGMDSGQAS
jgi:hypothetical protein